MRRSTHRTEHLGTAQGERVQGNVRDLQTFAKGEISDLEWFHGVGFRRIAMQDKDYRLTREDLRAATLLIDGALSAPRNIILPEVTDGRAFQRWFDNVTGQDLTFLNANGSQLLTAAQGVAFIVVYGDGPVAYT